MVGGSVVGEAGAVGEAGLEVGAVVRAAGVAGLGLSVEVCGGVASG